MSLQAATAYVSETCQNHPKMTFAAKCVGVGVACVAVATTAVPMVLTSVGFSAGGVVSGSAAACIQSTLYGAAVNSGSAFAVAQSVGAAGLGSTTVAGVGVTGSATYALQSWRSRL